MNAVMGCAWIEGGKLRAREWCTRIATQLSGKGRYKRGSTGQGWRKRPMKLEVWDKPPPADLQKCISKRRLQVLGHSSIEAECPMRGRAASDRFRCIIGSVQRLAAPDLRLSTGTGNRRYRICYARQMTSGSGNRASGFFHGTIAAALEARPAIGSSRDDNAEQLETNDGRSSD